MIGTCVFPVTYAWYGWVVRLVRLGGTVGTVGWYGWYGWLVRLVHVGTVGTCWYGRRTWYVWDGAVDAACLSRLVYKLGTVQLVGFVRFDR